jgi:hypothetical protein
LSPQTKTIALRVGLGLLGALAIWVFIYKAAARMPDFEVYWRAAARAAHAEPLYRASDGHFQFKYLPAFAVLAIPLGFLPLQIAKLLWFTISVGLVVLLLALNTRLPSELRLPARWLVFFTVIVFGKFYAHELVLGQVNLLFAVLVVLAIVWLRGGRDAGAGLLFALALVVKPYAVIFAPWLATRRNRTALVTMMTGLLVLLLLPAAKYGWDGNLRLLGDWWQTVTSTTAPNLTNPDNVSLSAMFTRWLGPDSPARILAAVAGAILLLLTAVVIAGRGNLPAPEALEGSLLLLLIPLLSPQGWDYVFLIGTPAVMLLINNLRSLPKELRAATVVAIAVVALSIFDIMGRSAYGLFMRLSLITVLVVIEVAALITLRFRRAA